MQSIEKTGSKEYIQYSNRTVNGVAQPNPDGFKISLANVGVKHPTYQEQIPNMLANIDHLRSFYNSQDHPAFVRSNYSSLEILCQIFPGRSRTSLESLLKVCNVLKRKNKQSNTK